MAKARSRSAAKKIKDKWKAKTWYTILAPSLFDKIPVAETLADGPNALIGRITDASLQDITNDFRKSHIKLFFRVFKVEDTQAQTQIVGHSLTSDYIRRMIRRRRSRIDGVYDVTTRDGAILRVKPFAIAEKRIQSSQKKTIREVMKKTISENAAALTLNEFISEALEGKVGSDIYKNCKNIYPVKRIEVAKTEVLQQPTIEIKEKKKPVQKEEPETVAEEKELEKIKEEKEEPTKESEGTEEKPLEKAPTVEKKKKTTKKTEKKTGKSKKKTTATKTKKKTKE